MTLGCDTSTEWTINWGKLPVVSLWAINFSQMVISSGKCLSHYCLPDGTPWVSGEACQRSGAWSAREVQLGTQQAKLLIRCHWLMLLWLDYVSGVSFTVCVPVFQAEGLLLRTGRWCPQEQGRHLPEPFHILELQSEILTYRCIAAQPWESCIPQLE